MKIGQKVRIVDKPSEIKHFNGGSFLDMDEYGGKVVTISNLFENTANVEENCYTWDLRALKPLEFKLDDIAIGDIITLKNGDKLIYVGDEQFTDLNDKNNNPITEISDFNDNLEYYDYGDVHEEDNDIIKIERPLQYSIEYERNEEIKEMTVEEISKALGYEVKIVKEKK